MGIGGQAAHAQSAAISANCSGTGTEDTISGTCTVTPYGNMNLGVTITTPKKNSHFYTLTFTFSLAAAF